MVDSIKLEIFVFKESNSYVFTFGFDYFTHHMTSDNQMYCRIKCNSIRTMKNACDFNFCDFVLRKQGLFPFDTMTVSNLGVNKILP